MRSVPFLHVHSIVGDSIVGHPLHAVGEFLEVLFDLGRERFQGTGVDGDVVRPLERLEQPDRRLDVRRADGLAS